MKTKVLNTLLKPFLDLQTINIGSISNATNQMVSIFNSLEAQGFIILKDEELPKEPVAKAQNLEYKE